MIMCAFICVMLSMIKDLEWWLRCRQLRVEAREGADRLVDILDTYIEQNRPSLYATML